MRVLILAPDFYPPWSEGRKKFIFDLAPKLAGAWEVSILSARVGASEAYDFSVPVTQIECRYKSTQLSALSKALDRYLAEGNRPDTILHFPFGTFSGIRGIVNQRGIAEVDGIARRAGIPCLTILYSMTNGSLARLARRTSHLVVGEGRDWSGLTLNIGIDLKDFPVVWPGWNDKKLLFMAGYRENKRSLLRAILFERGLMQVIRIGERLAESGYCLSIAIPLLRYPDRCEELRGLLARHAPKLTVELIPTASPVELFASHALFLFPFSVSYTRFMPTSMLEAMACGIPLIAPRLPMLEAVVRPDDAYCLGFPPGDDEAFLECIHHAFFHWQKTLARVALAAEMVRKTWGIDPSVERLKAIVRQVTKTKA